MTIHEFIKERRHLIWYVRDLKTVSTDAIVEAVLNYGDFDDVKEMIKILGIDTVADIFHEKINSKRCNYKPVTKRFYKQFFKRFASGLQKTGDRREF
jgi:hypothetical protein